ncbi:MAG: DUF3332 domain-containing protein [Bacteroidetes bacterium]|nr:MAG: DUF3332 domain-containing protein [Bacteroidota bacterium]MBL1145252.1 DUF3332 domain-containing protein [Bacteroidota bacterium]MCB0801782.1 DUF3332 domain-containing protein [Flavobacteriales bacterium]NOG58048.1 DUF3332 domain-containing protein [Bacteroidota bacterium]
MKKILFTAVAASIMITQTGCFGSFELTRKVWEFNESTFENKFLKTLMFYVMNIIPVYGVAGFLDTVIFNLIEFWSGSNPIAMAEGEIEVQYAKMDGENYKITATKNKMVFQQLKDGALIDQGEMVFSEEESTWNFVKNGESHNLITVNIESNTVDYNIGTSTQTVDLSNLDCIALNTKKNASIFAMK